MQKFVRKFYAIIFLALVGNSAIASMRAFRHFPVETVIAHFGKSADENSKSVVALTEIARSAFGITEIHFYGDGPDDVQTPATINAKDVARDISHAIHKLSDWQRPASTEIKNQLKATRKRLEDILPDGALAWVEYQIDGKDAAKATLKKLYDKEFERVLKIESAVYGGQGMKSLDIDEAEYLSKALIKFSTQSEKSEIERKMEKMKDHLHEIPAVAI